MAKLSLKAGTTSKLVDVFIQDSSSSVGAGLTGLAFGTASLTAYYYREGAASAVLISLLTMTLGTWTTAGFIVVDGTNMPGVYQIGLPDAALAAGAKSVVVMLKGAANMAPVVLEIELTAVDNQSATSFMTAVNGIAQTGDAFARLGAAGAGLTALGDTRIANLDAAVSTRSTYAGADTSGTTTLLSRVPGTVQPQTGDGYARIGAAGAGLTALGDTRIANLDATISSRTKPADTQAAVTTVTNLTNAAGAGDFTATMKTSLNAATPAVTISDKTGFALTAAYDAAKTAAQAGDAMALTSGERTTLTGVIWAAASRTMTSFGTLAADAAAAVWATATRTLSAFGFTVATDVSATVTTNLNATVSSRLAASGYTVPPTVTENADALLIRDWASVASPAAHSVMNALRGLGTTNKVTVNYAGNTITVYKEDGTTIAYTIPITTATGITQTITGVTP